DLSPQASFAASTNFWQGLNFYIRDLEYYTMVKLLAVLNIFSRDHYYIDVLLFEFLTIWGSVLLFKLLNGVFPWQKKLLIIALFLVPTTGFWLSGIRAEGLLLLFIAIILYFTNKWFEQKKLSQMLWILAGLAGFLIYRSQYLWVFLPAYIAWTLGKVRPQKSVYYFLFVYLLCLIVFVADTWISPQRNLATSIASRQHEFAQLHGNTRFRLDSLQPSVPGFIRLLPQAFANTFIRPLILEAKGPLQIMASLEVMAGWILVVLLLRFPVRDWKQKMTHPLLLLLLCYGVSQVLMIGYIVPFPGAIVRYKAIPELFLIITIGLSIDWKRIYSKIK
ncbi:MAG TPA: hypothetical protein VK543_16900, partial [Puia sp.]|nr:hypothetical protein [Puia sp.]